MGGKTMLVKVYSILIDKKFEYSITRRPLRKLFQQDDLFTGFRPDFYGGDDCGGSPYPGNWTRFWCKENYIKNMFYDKEFII
jgi:hypothetical protein